MFRFEGKDNSMTRKEPWVMYDRAADVKSKSAVAEPDRKAGGAHTTGWWCYTTGTWPESAAPTDPNAIDNKEIGPQPWVDYKK